MNSPHHPTRHGFTLIEMVIVMVILAILFAMIVPRIGSNNKRELQLASEQVADLLLMFARRESMGQKPVGLMNDDANGEMLLLVLDIDDSKPNEPAEWRIDRTVQPVKLPIKTYVAETRLDGRTISQSGLLVSYTPGEERQSIEITLATDDATRTVILPPTGLAPRIVDSSQPSHAVRTSIDLDAAGRHKENW